MGSGCSSGQDCPAGEECFEENWSINSRCLCYNGGKDCGCHSDTDCGSGLKCDHAGTCQCYNEPGCGCSGEDNPDAFCGAGLKCFDRDGRCNYYHGGDGHGCTNDYECGSGLQCWHGKCRCYKEAGCQCDPGHDECGSGLKCYNGRCRCYQDAGCPCHDDYWCGSSLKCSYLGKQCYYYQELPPPVSQFELPPPVSQFEFSIDSNNYLAIYGSILMVILFVVLVCCQSIYIAKEAKQRFKKQIKQRVIDVYNE